MEKGIRTREKAMAEPEKNEGPRPEAQPKEQVASPSPPTGEPEPSKSSPREELRQRYRQAWQARSQPAEGPPPPPEPKLAPPRVLAPGEEHQGKAPRLRDLDAQIEREFQEMMNGVSDQELYGQPVRSSRPAPGSETPRKRAKVVAVRGQDVFLDVPGGRAPGVLPLAQFEEGVPAPGTEVEVEIEGYDGANGLLLLSRKGAAVQADWSSVAAGMIVEARVTSTNKGGLSVDVNGIRGFMPISQIDLYRVEDPEQFVNQRLRCLVAEVRVEERNLVVSRRALQEKEREEAREKLWQELAEGQTREGIVRSVKDFGAFVDLGGVDGLLHVSEMSWARVDKAEQVVQPGQKIKVLILKLDPERRKVSLGLKQLQASPWDGIELNYPQGTTAKGKVTRLMDFGAFVELEPGIEGLVHISELAPQRVRRVSDVVQAGQEVQVMVLAVDRNQRRISLSLKAALPKPEEEAAEEPEEEVPAKPPRPRTTPLRGGLGNH
jgi:small subunit ribosomal protein S1